MELLLEAEVAPLRVDQDDVVRVGQTRVTLQTVVDVFEQGATPEEIVYQYPTLQLADVYAVIGYYLRHQAAVQAYLGRCRQEAQAVREENERRFPPHGIRERLMARRALPPS